MTPMAEKQSQPSAVADFMLPRAERSSVAHRTIRAAAEKHGWEVVWLAAVSVTFRPELGDGGALAAFEAACEMIGGAK